MEIKDYFDKLTKAYSSSFDLTIPYNIGSDNYLGYAHFYNDSSKYVLVKQAKLWEASSYEHVIFMEDVSNIKDTFEKATTLIKEYMEKELVRERKKYPKPNHMYSFLTVIILTTTPVPDEIKTKIEKFSFTKNYLFTIRGYTKGRLVVVDPTRSIFIANKEGSNLKTLCTNLFK